MKIPSFPNGWLYLYMCCYAFFFLFTSFISSPTAAAAPVTPSSTQWNQTDRSALLAFKSQINGGVSGTLNVWNDSFHHCDWVGITCSNRHRDRVTTLDLGSYRLEGTLSPFIGNLTFLTILDLTQNNFHGDVPQELGRLSRMKYLYLSNNSFSGGIPTNISWCSKLIEIDLSRNMLLSGGIPSQLSLLSKLQILGLGKNNFTGNIPSSFGNLTSLRRLSLRENHLDQDIPQSLCGLQKLEIFQVYSNSLTGKFPSCLFNLSNLYFLALTQNDLEGSLPHDIGLTLPNIVAIILHYNKFTGSIPLSLSNATKLEAIDVGGNAFTGSVPLDLGKLSNLQLFNLNGNQLGINVTDNLGFLASLTNCTNLQDLDIEKNFFQGPFPDSISNLSTTITSLYVGNNQIYGSIPVGIANLVNIEILSFQNSLLTGSIPPIMGNLKKLHNLYVDRNKLTGEIPASFGNLTQLENLELSLNHLNGSIPSTLGNCRNLVGLDLSRNNLTGTIPAEVIGLPSLGFLLHLSDNSLTGSLPPQVGNLTNLLQLSISRNKLSGHIPESIGQCLSLNLLDLNSNFFEGNIPNSLSHLRGLEILDLSHNNLSGEIPEYLVKLPLRELYLSFNQLQGQVPRTGVFANASTVLVDRNENLCGGIAELKLPPCIQKKRKTSSSFKMMIPVIVGSVCLLIVSCFFLIYYQRKKSIKKQSSETLFDKNYKRVTYSELLKATNGFSADNLVGVGSYGSVFKGSLEDINKVVAVKVLNLQRQGASKSFLTECNALRNLRHRNLLQIITACSSVDFQSNDFKALVFEYMSNGSLEDWLHPRADEQGHESRNLDFSRMLGIAIDVASALEYLHYHCQPMVVHCDLKPSNVLLNDDMTARVADFGIAKIFSVTSTESAQNDVSSIVIKGSIGYVAPEYGMGAEVSLQGDVYSYGILLLEMFTRRKPTDDMFVAGLSLHNYAQTALPSHALDIVDPMLVIEENSEETNTIGQTNIGDRLRHCLVSAVKLGVMCSYESPQERMTMSEVVIELQHIRDYYQGVRSYLE